MEIIKIGAMWCPGCIVMKKTFKQIEEDFNIEIKSLDLDFDEEEVSKYNVGDTLPVIIVNKDGKEINQSNIDATRLAELITLINDGKISTKQAKEVFEIMKASSDKPSDIASSKGMVQISDTSSIDTWVKEVLDENPSVIEQFKNGRTNVIGFLVGQVIKKSKGQANPGLVSKVLNEKIKEY